MKTITLLLLLLYVHSFSAHSIISYSDTIVQSKKHYFKLKYNTAHWTQKQHEYWDLEFESQNGMFRAFFHEKMQAVKKDEIHKLISGQFEETGKVKNYVITEDRSSERVKYNFSFTLKYYGYEYKYMGLIYFGTAGSYQIMVQGGEDAFNFSKAIAEEMLNSVVVDN